MIQRGRTGIYRRDTYGEPTFLYSVSSSGGALALGLGLVGGCDRKTDTSVPAATQASSSASPQLPAAGNDVELLLSYGSEKQKWIDAVTADFNGQRKTLAGGKAIHVTAKPGGSGETMAGLLDGTVHAQLWSPASGVYVKLANATSQAKGGPLVGPTQNLVLSPVVIGMWKPMAEALGWPAKPIGWSDVIALAKNPQGWAAYGHGEFGPFKFGHTHPEYSNSGLISILAETYAGAGKVRGLSNSDIDDPNVGQYLEDIESSVVHYGESTGFFGRRLYEDGPKFLSAAVLYENMVVESYSKPSEFPALVAIYPKEGTFWSDHPIGIVQRDWVNDEQREAGKIYIDFLRAAPQQAKALAAGFRPAEGDLGAPIDAAHGVDPAQPATVLELPSADMIERVISLWQKHKKPASVVVVFDRSGSMDDDNKIIHARAGALELVNMLSDRDTLGLVPFSSTITVIPMAPLSTGRGQMVETIKGIYSGGQTRLYEAILAGHDMLLHSPQHGRICAVIVLTDGEDNGPTLKLPELLKRLALTGEESDVRIFTIGYGESAQLDDLKKVSKQTKGEFYQGKPENIRTIFQKIATFF